MYDMHAYYDSMTSRTLLVLALTAEVLGVQAIWPFSGSEERYTTTTTTEEALVNAGSLGIEGTGRVVAIGDWNGDQHADLFTLAPDEKSVQIHLWDRSKYRYTPSQTLASSSKILNVVPADFNHDGRLDLLVMCEEKEGSWWNNGKSRTKMQVYLGAEGGGFEDPWILDTSTDVQGIIFDDGGTLKPSLLAFEPQESGDGLLRSWYNDGTTLRPRTAPLINPEQACTLASPHSSAYIDIDGDCLPDLVLHCAKPRSSEESVQIWLNRGLEGYELSRTYDLPKESGALAFADMNRDGTMDIVFPTCARWTTSTGIGYDCNINIAYNKQIPICSSEASKFDSNGKLTCRGYGELCQSDPDYAFDFGAGSESLVSLPLSSILPTSGDPQLLLHVPGDPSIPLPIRLGDYNVDGFPDLLLTIHNSTAAPGGGVLAGSRKAGNQVKVLENVPCSKGVAGCEGKKDGRGLKVGSGSGWEALDEIWDASGASWLDIDDDGTLDIMVQRSGDQGAGTVTFVRNDFYQDAFFIKAQVLNGACDGDCWPEQGKKYTPLGVSYSGATYKFTVLDTLGRRVAQQVAQLPQTGYHALGTPYAYFGLGRTNNYVERLFVGASLYPPNHVTALEALIPNSQLIINPPYPLSLNDTDSDPMTVPGRPTEWRSELYLQPGDWVPWVAAAVAGAVAVLGFVVLGLRAKEQREDENERRRALHAINFQAL